jgi:phosphatidate cytidylyltransferase
MLIKRMVSGAILLMLAVICIYFGGFFLWGAGFLVAMIGISEISGVMDLEPKKKKIAWAGTVICYLLLPVCPEMLRIVIFAADIVGLAVMGAHVIRYPEYELGTDRFARFMIIYPGIMSSCTYMVRNMPDGLLLAYLVMAASWGCDTMAYVTGMTLGRLGNHHPFPVLSPKKSVEGCIGGVLGAAVIGALLARYMGGSVTWAVMITAAGAVAGELGDLAASSIKRKYGKKDYSNLIAGHGGVMDRFDSTLFSGALIFCIALVRIWLR